MAVSRDSTVLPRRTLLAGAAAVIAAAPVMMTLPTAALPSAGHSVYAEKRRVTVAAWAKYNNLLADQHHRLKALGPAPAVPEGLLQPMRLPYMGTPSAAPKGGWTARDLSEIVRTGLALTAVTVSKTIGVRTEWKVVSTKTRTQAEELLKVRESYDAKRQAWWEKVQAIEKQAIEPMNEAISLAFDLMAYPASTVAEVKDKMALAEEWDLLNLTDEDDSSLHGNLIRDAHAVAEKAVAHA